MATDATGTPTSLGIPKYSTSTDAPSGKGFNATMDVIDTLVAARIPKPVGPSANQALVWDGANWVAVTIANAQIAAGAGIVYSKLNLAASIVSADIVDGTIVNADINAAAAIAPSKVVSHGFTVYRSTDQVMGAADGVMSFDTAVFQSGSTFWSGGAPTRITMPFTGNYLLAGAMIQTAGALAGAYGLFMRLNGTTAKYGGAAVSQATFQMNHVFRFTAGDFIEIVWSHGTSTAISIGGVGVGNPIGAVPGVDSIYKPFLNGVYLGA